MSDPSNDKRIIRKLSVWAVLTLLVFLLPGPFRERELLHELWAWCGRIAILTGSVAALCGIWAAIRRPSAPVIYSAAFAVLVAIAVWWRALYVEFFLVR